MQNLDLFYDHCAQIFAALTHNFPSKMTLDHAEIAGADPHDDGDDNIRLVDFADGAIDWLVRSGYIHAAAGSTSHDRAVLSEKGLRFLQSSLNLRGELSLADFRRAAESLLP